MLSVSLGNDKFPNLLIAFLIGREGGESDEEDGVKSYRISGKGSNGSGDAIT